MNAHLRRLVAEICALIGVVYDATDATDASHVALRIANFDVLLVCERDKPQYAGAYFDLGPLPEQGREALLLQMLEINHGLGPSCRGMLSVEPESQRVRCVLPFLLDELTTGRAVLDELTAFAKALREEADESDGLRRVKGPIPLGWA